MAEEEFKAAVGMSREWDAYGAGHEVATNTLDQLGEKPDFILLFATIHYEKHGGFEKFLEGVWDVLPKGTPLIGGTVGGFINPQGCFTRGATAIAVKYPGMDVGIGIGYNTKRNPKNAARNCTRMIIKKLEGSKYNNKFLYSLMSGSIVPEFPGFKGGRRIFPGFLGRMSILLSPFLNILGKGAGKEEEMLDELSRNMPNQSILTGSCMDSGLFVKNYQFFYNKITTNTVVGIGIQTDLIINVEREHGLTTTNKNFKVTSLSKDKRIIHEINNKPALKEFLHILGWPYDFIDERLHRRTLFYPMGIKKSGRWMASVIGLVLENSFLMTDKTLDNDICILSGSGKGWTNAVNNILSNNKLMRYQPMTGIIISCAVRLEGLGNQIYKTHKLLLDFFKDIPFLGIYVSGEGLCDPIRGVEYGNETFNLVTFSKKL